MKRLVFRLERNALTGQCLHFDLCKFKNSSQCLHFVFILYVLLQFRVLISQNGRLLLKLNVENMVSERLHIVTISDYLEEDNKCAIKLTFRFIV